MEQAIKALQEAVTNLLVAEYDFEMDEAEEAVKESAADEPDLWHENANKVDLAKHVASEGEDE